MNEAIQIVIGGLLQGSVFAVLALGFSLVFRVTGVINLAQGAFCILGALLMYSFQVALGWPTLPAALAATLGTAAFGFAIGRTIFVPALPRLPVSSMLVMTAGMLTLVEGVLLVVWGSQPYATPPFSGEAPVSIWGVLVPTQGFWIAGIAALAIAALWWLLQRTDLGMALRACAENRVAARLMGIDVARMTLVSFVLAATIAGIGGIAVGPITSLEFDTGRYFTNFGFISVAIGGLGTFMGSVVGGLGLGVAEQLAAGYVSSLFANGLALGLLLVVLLWRPNGLFAGGPARRSDVRDEQRVYRAIVRIDGRGGTIFGAIFLAALIVLPWLLPPGSLLDSLVITGILFIGVLGLDVLMGFAGQVSLGQSGFLAIGGYTAAILATNYDLPPLLGVAAGIALSLLCAFLLSLVTTRLRGHYLALATLTFGLLVDSLTVGLTETTGGPSGLVGIPSFSVAGYAFATPISMYYLVLGIIVVLILALLGAMRSSFGRALKAVRTDQTAAAALGVDVRRHKTAALAISAVLASLAGSLYAFQFHFLSPEMVATPRSFEMIAMLVAGGEGTLIGPLFGVALLTLLPTLFQPLAVYKTFGEGLLLVLCFMWLPEGMFGAAAAWLARRFGASRPPIQGSTSQGAAS
ncbi:MAG TPA: ABC transporter permease [Alphaproteobacteria bacterium]|nr:ABC transporter permease [Alphaproteobacteria bacterium]